MKRDISDQWVSRGKVRDVVKKKRKEMGCVCWWCAGKCAKLTIGVLCYASSGSLSVATKYLICDGILWHFKN